MMPELPEVETVRRGLLPVMEGRRIARAEVRRPDLRWPFPERMAERLTGAIVAGIGRRSKYLLLGLDTGETLIVHLGMSGRMLVGGQVLGEFHHDVGAAPGPHDHVILTMEDGGRVTFNDARRFGVMDLWPSEDLSNHRLLRSIGPEPLSNGFSAETLARAFEGKAAPVKSALLDHRIVAGLGNIYVSEALARAGISPTRAAGRIGRDRLERLVPAIRQVLEEAIEAGGSTLRDHRRADGELGYFQHSFRVYDQEGKPCRTEGCAGVVRRIVQAGRSSYYCPSCQR
jgi:formamidopyrimidine-DNA glycosylase